MLPPEGCSGFVPPHLDLRCGGPRVFLLGPVEWVRRSGKAGHVRRFIPQDGGSSGSDRYFMVHFLE